MRRLVVTLDGTFRLGVGVKEWCGEEEGEDEELLTGRSID